MAYTTPVYDRTLSDVLARNSKAYLSLADWQRIDSNAQETATAINLSLGGSISLVAIAAMTTSSIPDTDDVNDLAGNIEMMRAFIDANFTVSDSDFTEVKDDYTSPLDLTHTGYSYPFQVVNQWEKVLDIMYNLATNLTKYNLVSAGGDQFVTANGDTLIANSL